MSRKTILMSPADSNIYKFFERQFNIISSDCLDNFISFEKYHADMQALNINGKLFINSACKSLTSKLDALNLEYTVCCDIGCKYPQNVALNAALAGRKLLCNEKALHASVKEYCKNTNIQIINVNQGYSKCSTLVLNDNSIITDDESIANAAFINNKNVLKIAKGDIYLDNNNYGFIGGASAKIGDTVYFFGDINTHSDGKEIKSFIKNAELNIECASSTKLTDIGGIVILN